jgi:hypothetical protein
VTYGISDVRDALLHPLLVAAEAAADVSDLWIIADPSTIAALPERSSRSARAARSSGTSPTRAGEVKIGWTCRTCDETFSGRRLWDVCRFQNLAESVDLVGILSDVRHEDALVLRGLWCGHWVPLLPRSYVGGHNIPREDGWPAWLRDRDVTTIRVYRDDRLQPIYDDD